MADLSLFGKGQRLVGLHPDSPQGESDKSGGSRRHVGSQWCGSLAVEVNRDGRKPLHTMYVGRKVGAG